MLHGDEANSVIAKERKRLTRSRAMSLKRWIAAPLSRVAMTPGEDGPRRAARLPYALEASRTGWP